MQVMIVTVASTNKVPTVSTSRHPTDHQQQSKQPSGHHRHTDGGSECECLNWKETYRSQQAVCGQGPELRSVANELHTSLELVMPFLQSEYCIDFFERLDHNRCVNLQLGTGAAHKTWCYVSPQCHRLGNGIEMPQAGANWKTCSDHEDSHLRDLTLPELWAVADANELDLGILLKSAYPVQPQRWPDVEQFWWFEDFSTQPENVRAARDAGTTVIYEVRQDGTGDKIVASGEQLWAINADPSLYPRTRFGYECMSGCESLSQVASFSDQHSALPERSKVQSTEIVQSPCGEGSTEGHGRCEPGSAPRQPTSALPRRGAESSWTIHGWMEPARTELPRSGRTRGKWTIHPWTDLVRGDGMPISGARIFNADMEQSFSEELDSSLDHLHVQPPVSNVRTSDVNPSLRGAPMSAAVVDVNLFQSNRASERSRTLVFAGAGEVGAELLSTLGSVAPTSVVTSPSSSSQEWGVLRIAVSVVALLVLTAAVFLECDWSACLQSRRSVLQVGHIARHPSKWLDLAANKHVPVPPTVAVDVADERSPPAGSEHPCNVKVMRSGTRANTWSPMLSQGFISPTDIDCSTSSASCSTPRFCTRSEEAAVNVHYPKVVLEQPWQRSLTPTRASASRSMQHLEAPPGTPPPLSPDLPLPTVPSVQPLLLPIRQHSSPVSAVPPPPPKRHPHRLQTAPVLLQRMPGIAAESANLSPRAPPSRMGDLGSRRPGSPPFATLDSRGQPAPRDFELSMSRTPDVDHSGHLTPSWNQHFGCSQSVGTSAVS